MLILNSRDFWTCLFSSIFESCLFSSHAYLKVARFLDMLIFKYWIFEISLLVQKLVSTKCFLVRLATVQLSRERHFQFSWFRPYWRFWRSFEKRNHNIWWIKNVSRNHLSIMLIFASMLILSSSSFGSCLFSSHAYYRVNAYFRETTVVRVKIIWERRRVVKKHSFFEISAFFPQLPSE